jgi:hypothetical protein
MPEKYIVNLNTEEREYLHQLTHKGKYPARVFKRADILLLADDSVLPTNSLHLHQLKVL